jgi:hypothetical protein
LCESLSVHWCMSLMQSWRQAIAQTMGCTV